MNRSYYFCYRWLLTLLIYCLTFSLAAQTTLLSPYNVNSRIEGGVLSVGTGLSTLSFLLDRRVSPFTDADLTIFNIDDIPGIDRYSVRHFSPKAQKISDFSVYAAFAMPLTLLLNQRSRMHFDEVGLMLLQGGLLTGGIINMTKVLVKRPRPYLFNADVPMDFKTRRKARYSFFSGHVAVSAYCSFTTAKMFNDFYPDSKWRPVVWTAAATWPFLTGFGRMRAGKHYLTDVLAGYAVGAIVGVLIPAIHLN